MDCVKKITDAAQEVMKVLSKMPASFIEKQYEEALFHELRLRKIPYDRQRNIEIIYKGHTIGSRRPDMVLYPAWCKEKTDEYLIDIKCKVTKDKAAIKQVQVYLLSMNIPKGAVLNFNKKSGEVEFIEIERPNRELRSDLEEPSRKTKANVKSALEKAAKEVLDYLGTEFFYYDAGIYINALSAELRLKGLDFHQTTYPILYKEHKIDEYTYDYIFTTGEAAKVFTYKDPEKIEEMIEELKHSNKMFAVEKGYILGIPEVEDLKVIVKEV